MGRHRVLLGFTLSLIVCFAAIPASAEEVIEAWRGGGFKGPHFVSVDPTDGSCWVADYLNHQVVRLGADGTELLRVGGFEGPWSVSVDPTDGSCWVADTSNGQVVHLAEDGAELWGIDFGANAYAISVNATDGSCWVVDRTNMQVVHLAEDGTQLWRGGDFASPSSVSVSPTDGSCWVADYGGDQVVHLVIYDGPPPVFDDVPPGFWAFEEIGACYDAGIVGGYGDGLYHPEYAVTRDQMAVYVARAFGLLP
jgi:DNA-binding beta-propeller fold protein YncE